MLNPKLARIRKSVPLKKGINPQLQRVVDLPQQTKVLTALDARTRNLENAKRIAEASKQESSSVASDATSNDDSRTWKIMIGVGLGIAVVTAVGFYALKE